MLRLFWRVEPVWATGSECTWCKAPAGRCLDGETPGIPTHSSPAGAQQWVRQLQLNTSTLWLNPGEQMHFLLGWIGCDSVFPTTAEIVYWSIPPSTLQFGLLLAPGGREVLPGKTLFHSCVLAAVTQPDQVLQFGTMQIWYMSLAVQCELFFGLSKIQHIALLHTVWSVKSVPEWRSRSPWPLHNVYFGQFFSPRPSTLRHILKFPSR